MDALANIRKARMEDKELIKELLNMSELEYGNMLVDNGLSYLNRLLGGDEEMYHRMKESTMFWIWFENHWFTRNTLFLNEAEFWLSEAVLRTRYYTIHHPDNMRFYPNKNLMADLMREPLKALAA